jgi:hypothetical protein
VALIVVTSANSGEGKTGVAAAVARHFAYKGRTVTLTRIADDGPASNAVADAAWFGSLDFVPGTPLAPVQASAVTDPGPDALGVVEANLAAATMLGAPTILASCTTAPKSLPPGINVVAVIVTCVQGAARLPETVGDAPVIGLPDDRALAGFSVSEVRSALNAETLVEGDGRNTTCDHLVIAPIASDAGQPYFRRFASQAVVVRFDRTDMHLAAMQADPECLILTGGRRPSDYLFDAAGAKGIPVLLSRTDTENTVIALEGIFDRTRFHGDRKLDRMSELLEASALFTGGLG